jgi:hypothetical protein
MTHGGRLLKTALVTFLVFSLVAPFPGWSNSPPLGTAHGVRAAKLSIDGGKTWLAVTGRSLPVLNGAELRTAGGSAVLDLTDGSRVGVLPFSTVQFKETNGTTGLSLLHGRLTFRLPVKTRVEILTPSARLEPVRRQAMVGEVFAGSDGLMGLKMSEGSLQVRSLADERRTILASLEPVFLPKRPATSDSFFSTDPATPIPAGAKGIFAPGGESIGYLGPDGKFVIYPAFTNDLTRPFSPKLVQLAMATIPENDRKDEAVPLFDVNGGYVGYLAGPVFYAQATQQPTTPPAPPARGMPVGAIAAIGAGSAAAIGLGIAAGTGAFDRGRGVASPIGPP